MKKQSGLFLVLVLILLTFTGTSVFAKGHVKISLQGPPAPPMTIAPLITHMGFDEEREFQVHGGTPPFVFKTSAGLIRYVGDTATYISPNVAGQASISVKDAKGLIQTLVIQIENQPKIPELSPK